MFLQFASIGEGCVKRERKKGGEPYNCVKITVLFYIEKRSNKMTSVCMKTIL